MQRVALGHQALFKVRVPNVLKTLGDVQYECDHLAPRSRSALVEQAADPGPLLKGEPARPKRRRADMELS